MVRLDQIMTEEEFRILEQRMAANRGELANTETYYPDPTSTNWPEWMIEAECTRLLEMDGWRALRTDPVSDRGRGKGFGELGMADHLYFRYETVVGCPQCGLNCHDRPLCPQCGVATIRSPWKSDVLWIEFKSAKVKPAKHQIEWHTKERARGALTLIAGEDFPASVAGFVEWYRKSGLNRGRI